MPRKIVYCIFLIVSAIVFAYAAYRDFRYGKDFSHDLRNRIVGARLEKDGKLPYFHNWQKGDSTRYYDPVGFGKLAVTNMTATPFFHQLLYPLADLDQPAIKGWWLFLEYTMVVLMTAMAFSLASTDWQRSAVLAVACLFLLTDAWVQHTYDGQIYICFPFFAMAFYFFIRRDTNLLRASMAGTIAIMLVLMRPNTCFFFIPFLFLLKTYGRRYLLFFGIPVFLLTAWTMADQQERALWQDYRMGMVEQIKMHQGLHPTQQKNEPDPGYPRWEGVDQAAVKHADSTNPVRFYSENGNFFIPYEYIFHRRIPPMTLFLLSLGVIGLLTALFYSRIVRKGNLDPSTVALFGYALYMVSDLFSPVYRHQYYTVQWIFPILLMAARVRSSLQWPFWLAVAGLLLNISKVSFFTMEHTIGEYLILAALLALTLNTDGRLRPDTH